ncbi:telomere-associated protein Tap [Kitasatospora sp. NPDC008050]|uniref:telomere-associated protein Tap n=1 Tax=Kitasatospora sp. NPDC008050 TaxID=3364021 RepID=UPI0036EAD8DB
MPTEEELFAGVDALLASGPVLPPPDERARLREAAGATQEAVAQALKSSVKTVKNWEAGRSEPRPPRLQAYIRLLEGWAAKYPAPGDHAEPAGDQAVPETFTAPTPAAPALVPPGPLPVQAPPATAQESAPAKASSPGRPARKAGPTKLSIPGPILDPRFHRGPLAVVDGDGSVYCADGLVLQCPAETIPQLVEWTLGEAGFGASRLNRHGQDADPLVVLTASAAERFNLPLDLDAHDGGRSRRLPQDHPVVKQITRAKWQLTRRGLGPWPRIYRPAESGRRQCVQLAILPWGALDVRDWGKAFALAAADGTADPAELARVLGIYAHRVLTPRGGGATCGMALMEALRPPTRAVKDETTGGWVSGPNSGALTRAVDPAPPEAVPEHPVAQGWTGGFINEEAYQWVRPVELLGDEECLLPFAVGLDLNTAFLAAAARLTVGLGAPVHLERPAFDKKVPGTWLVDLSHVELDPRLPSPFTPTGERPTGPAWYATPTVAYAAELGYQVQPLEAFLRHETGAYLDPWHDRLKGAYVATLADLGVTADLDEQQFLAAMAQHKQRDPGLAAVLTAVKATVKGGVGKLRERPQGRQFKDGERWPALDWPTWRPDIRAAVISKARVNMHRKLNNMAKTAGLYPLAVLSDCVVYPSPGPSPLDFLPRTPDGKPVPGAFRLGPTPGLAKLEGVQQLSWAVDLLEQGYNPARHIKGDGHDAVREGE